MKKIIVLSIMILAGIFVMDAQDIGSKSNIPGFKPGQIISTEDGKIQRAVYRLSDKAYDSNIIGVYNGKPESNRVADAFINNGTIEVLISPKSETIEPGDYITSAGDGMGMKATKSGMVIGQAIEKAEGGRVKIYVNIGFQKIE